MIFGSATGSLVCERMGLDRLVDLEVDEVYGRVREFRELTAFDHPVAPVHG